MKRRIYVYKPHLDDELVAFFGAINGNIHIEKVEDDVITIIDEDYYNLEPVNLQDFQVLLVEDFDNLVTIFIEPYLEEEFALGKKIKHFIKEVPHNVYFFEDIITYVVLKDNNVLKNEVKEYIKSKVKNEVIHTVREFIDNNMNSSLSAKKLFMHRNTLNYRIDNFIELTHINVKTFKGANAIYMLYKF